MKTNIEIAREAGFVEYELEDYTQSGYDIRYERFADLVRADEREACALMVMPLDESLADNIRGKA
jgi:hypothetical protein